MLTTHKRSQQQEGYPMRPRSNLKELYMEQLFLECFALILIQCKQIRSCQMIDTIWWNRNCDKKQNFLRTPDITSI